MLSIVVSDDIRQPTHISRFLRRCYGKLWLSGMDEVKEETDGEVVVAAPKIKVRVHLPFLPY